MSAPFDELAGNDTRKGRGVRKQPKQGTAIETIQFSLMPSLSKSRYLSGDQCHLRLWYDSYERHLSPPPDDALQAVFDTGHEVGEFACERHPGGHSVGHDHRHVREALEETRQILRAGAAPALFEPAFRHEGVLVRVDILERLPGGGWRMGEVKSTTRLKDVFVLDLAVQLWVLRGAGLDVREVEVITLNRDYVYDGVRLDLDALFRRHPLTDQAEALQGTVGAGVREMLAMLGGTAAPEIAPGDHCFDPYDCPYYAHCTRDHVSPDHGIDELPWLRGARRGQLQDAGIVEIRDVPAEFPLSYVQRIVRRAVQQNCAVIHGDVAAELAGLRSPVRYLDFETFSPAIPRFAGTRPYDAVPFLFSVHSERDGSPLEHTDYLHEEDDDPRPRLADRLIEAVGSHGSICTYSGYERSVLTALAAAVPERADELAAVSARLFDLLPVVRNTCYHPEFRGSFSIKNVLPALVPGMGYGDLEIPDGQAASVAYMRALDGGDGEERQRLFGDLRAYCARDTLAMVRLREALGAL